MKRFFFHIRDGKTLLKDDEGTELPDMKAAHEYAVIAARELIAALVLNGDIIDGQVFEITDDSGAIKEFLPMKSALRLA